MALTLSSNREATTVTITVEGDIDLSTVDDLERYLSEQVTDDVSAAEMDLTGVRFLDSAGINVLVTARRKADEQGRTFRVTGASGLVRELLEMTGVWLYLSDTVT